MFMEIELTFDDDAAFELTELQKKECKTFDQILNETLRRGLELLENETMLKPFEVKAMDLGKVADDIDFDKISELSEKK
jgi:hypothetical protein